MQDAAPAVGGHQDVLDLLRTFPESESKSGDGCNQFLGTICDEINTFRIEVNARFDGVDARLDGFDIRLGRLSASHYEVTALQRVLDAINLWWDIQLDAIANHKVFATTPGYGESILKGPRLVQATDMSVQTRPLPRRACTLTLSSKTCLECCTPCWQELLSRCLNRWNTMVWRARPSNRKFRWPCLLSAFTRRQGWPLQVVTIR